MHPNGKPVAILYHVSDFENIDMQGGIINFNLLRANGENIGYSEVLSSNKPAVITKLIVTTIYRSFIFLISMEFT